MPANVCKECDIAWPSGKDFYACPDCGNYTHYEAATQRELTVEEARRRARFREFYEGWDEERQRRGDPSPEALGALQARREINQIRDLEAAL